MSVRDGAIRAGGFAREVVTASVIMSVSQYVEMGLTHRAPSDLPVRLVEAVVRRPAAAGLQARAAGELGQGSLAATALVSAHLMRRVPAIPAIVGNALWMSLFNALVVRAVGVGGMPWTWSRSDLAVDLTPKTALSLASRAIVEHRHGARSAG